MKAKLESFSTEALVQEVKRRFAEVDKARNLLTAGFQDKRPRTAKGPEQGTRKRGGTSAYARQISSLVQKIRHAKGRGETKAVSKLEAQLEKLRTSKKG